MGFLVRASLRKWWKFWVLVGTKAPPAQTQGKLCKEASCQLPQLATKGAAAWSVLLLHHRSASITSHQSCAVSPHPRPTAYSGNQAQSLASLCPMGAWLEPHQRVLSLSLGGWKLLFDMSIKALGRM